jgi:hypothetical protein
MVESKGLKDQQSSKEQETEQVSRNQEKLNAKEPKGIEEGRGGGGLVKGIINFVKGIFTATIDMPRRGQFGDREANSDQRVSEAQGKWINYTVNHKTEQDIEKNPKDLDQKKVKAAAEGLKEIVKRNTGGSDQPIEGMAPDQTPVEATQEKDGPQVGS